MTKVCQKVFHDFLAYFFTIFEVFEQVSQMQAQLLDASLVYCASDTPHYENVPFEVPKGWCWCKFGEYLDVRDGTHDSPKYVEKGYPFVTSKNLNNGKIDFATAKFISEEDHINFSQRSFVEDGDILFAMIGSIGNPVLVVKDREFSIKNVALFKPYDKRNSYMKYVLYYLLYIQEHLKQGAKGGMQPFIPLNYFRKDLFIPLPPLNEQQHIVKEIEKWSVLIDIIESGKADLQTAIKQTKNKILDLAIHGKLVTQNPNDEPASELLKRINPNAEITCDNGLYGKIPSSWSMVSMDLLCSLTDGEKQSGIGRINLDVKFLRGEREARMLASGRFIPANTLLILVDGENSGEVFRTPIDGYQGSTFKQLSINDNMNTDYMIQIINMHRQTLRENKVGSAIPHLNKKLFKAIKVPVPPLAEQQRIVDAIDKAFAKLDIIMESL